MRAYIVSSQPQLVTASLLVSSHCRQLAGWCHSTPPAAQSQHEPGGGAEGVDIRAALFIHFLYPTGCHHSPYGSSHDDCLCCGWGLLHLPVDKVFYIPLHNTCAHYSILVKTYSGSAQGVDTITIMVITASSFIHKAIFSAAWDRGYFLLGHLTADIIISVASWLCCVMSTARLLLVTS